MTYFYCFVFLKEDTYFTRGRTDILQEAIGSEGPNCFSKGGSTRISKGTSDFQEKGVWTILSF